MSAYLPSTALLEIDLSAIQENYKYMKSLSDVHVTHAAVVKSDAYGLGLVPVAKALVEAGCFFFFVANLEEGVLLRAACPMASIAVFRGDLGKYAAVYERHGLIPVVNTLGEMSVIRHMGLSFPIMLNVDTGLSRLGLSPREVIRLYLGRDFDRIPLAGIMSHLACSAKADDPTNELQRNRFQAIYQLLQPCSGSLAASAGVWLGKRYHFDMVRLGSAIYGLNDPRLRPNPLRSVLRLSAPILEIRVVPQREAVGYGAVFRAQRRTRIAVVGMGYLIGLPWSCGNRVSARLGRFSAPVIGRVSMEYLTLDVTDIPESACHAGTWIDLLHDHLGVDDLADTTAVASQEIVLRLGAVCPRQYTGIQLSDINDRNSGGFDRNRAGEFRATAGSL